MHSRKRFLEVLPDEEFEYDFVPLCMVRFGRPTVFVHDIAGSKAHPAPYDGFPRIKSRAHPFFVLFMADKLVSCGGASSLPYKKVSRLMDAIIDITECWEKAPPKAFLVGPDVWREHRHPLSDDGRPVPPIPQASRAENAAKAVRARKTTHAPRPPPKVTAKKTPYTQCDPRPPCERRSVLPRFEASSDDEPSDLPSDLQGGYSYYGTREVLVWLSGVARASPCPCDPAWLDSETLADSELAEYRREPARDPHTALHPRSLFSSGSLVIGQGEDRTTWSSNDWAMRVCRSWLWSSKFMATLSTDTSTTLIL
ncbi:hypothetical protein HDZ31DRAFT_65503 [Schizophyllum fasciatum]